MNNSSNRIYLSSPHMGGEELNYIHDAFDKNWIAPLGANVDGFEKDIQSYVGRGHAAVVTSGTAAIHLGLILCGVESGDEVICQSFTFAASANPILYQGATPVFVDSEPETWNMDPELLEQAILDRMEGGATNGSPSRRKENGTKEKRGRKPKAIIIVHLYGMPAKMDRILEVAAKYDIPVIEDAAEALGSSIEDKMCGSFGKFSVLSFNGNKIITTSGGGALLSDDENLIKKTRFLATQARDDAPHYQHSQLGYNYRMSNIAAGIGRGQIKVLDKRVAARRDNHNFYFDNLGKTWLKHERAVVSVEQFGRSNIQNREFEIAQSPETGIYFLKEPEGFFSNRWLTTIIVNPGETGGVTREDIRLALEKENIESRPVWKPMHLQPLYRNFSYYGRGISDKLFDRGLCLPSGSNLTEYERKRVVTTINNVLQS